MIGAARVESSLALRAEIVAGQVGGDAERAFAVAAVNGFGVKLRTGPHDRGMAGGFAVALNAGVEGPAALELDGHNVARGVVVSAVGALVHCGAVAQDGFRAFHLAESNRST